MLPSRRFILLILAGAPIFLAGAIYDFFAGVGVLYVLFLLLYVTFDAILLTRKKSIAVRRIVPDRFSLGASTPIRYEIQNRSRRQIRIEISEVFPDTITSSPEQMQATAAPGETISLECRVCPYRRGRFELSDIYVRVLPYMGLLYRQFVLSVSETVSVYPNFKNIQKYELLARKGLSYEQGLAKLRKPGEGGEFESLRRYVIGDEISRIEWKASAKRARLIVKNFQPERQQNILVAIDLGRATAGEFGGMSRVDYMINATLMLAYVALRQNDWFSLIAFSDRIEQYLPPVNGIKNIERVTRALFDLQPRLVESDYGTACRFLRVKNRKRSLMCMLTDVVDVQASDVIISYLSRFARYHLPLAVTLSNPEIQDLAERPLAETDDYYSKAAALDTLHAREQALISMRQKGVSVLDVPPSKLTPELINRYTLIKSTHRL